MDLVLCYFDSTLRNQLLVEHSRVFAIRMIIHLLSANNPLVHPEPLGHNINMTTSSSSSSTAACSVPLSALVQSMRSHLDDESVVVAAARSVSNLANHGIENR